MSSVLEQDDPQTETQPQPQPPPSRGGNGCLWGCLIFVAIAICSVLCMGFGAYWLITDQVAKYTSDTPAEIKIVDIPEEELEALKGRVKTFQDSLDKGEVPEEDLVLTADEINALIASNEDLRGRVFVEIDGDVITGDVSVPLDAFPLMKGRFFNGSASVDVSMENGVLIVTAREATVNGEPVPEQFMEQMREQNLAKDVYKDPENAKFMRQFEDIRVEDGKIYLRLRREQDSVQTNPLLEETDE